MKIYTTIVLALFLILGHQSSVSAQKVYEDDVSMSLGIKNALIIELEGSDDKIAEKIWKEYIKDYGKTKKNKKANEWYSQQITVPSIDGATPIDIYVKFDENRDMTRAYLWIDLGGEFLNSLNHEDKTVGAEDFLVEYAKDVRKYVIGEEIKDEEKKLKNLNDDLEDLGKKNEKYRETIAECKAKIMKAEEDMLNNEKDQKDKNADIEAQKMVIEKIIDRLNAVDKKF